MPELPAQQELAARARLAVAGLALGRNIDHASLAFTIVAAVAALWLDAAPAIRLALLSAIVAGLAQKLFALRVAFDCAVFSDWAERWE